MDSLPTNKSDENGFSEHPVPTVKAEPTQSPDDVSPPKVNKDRMRYVVLDCLDAGKTRQEIRQKLMFYGYSENGADKFIENVEREQRKTKEYDDEFRGDAKLLMRFGGGTCLLGIVVLIGCIIAACNDYDLVQDPLWLAGMFIAGTAKFVGARLFWRGLSQ